MQRVRVRSNHHLRVGQPAFDEHSGTYVTVKRAYAPDDYDVEMWTTGEVVRKMPGRQLRAAYFGSALAQIAREFAAEARADYQRRAITTGELNEVLRAAQHAVASDEDAALIQTMRSYAQRKRGG